MTALRFNAGEFFGGALTRYASGGLDVSHRIADRRPEDVHTHTHEDAHFVLITGGQYVSSAAGRADAGRPTLVYNPPGTTHRDHFERGRGSFFAISIAPSLASGWLADLPAVSEALHLTAPLQQALVSQIARGAATQEGDLSLQALCLELLGSMTGRAVASERPSWLIRALELINDRQADPLTMREIAATVGVHPVHLARAFRRFYRCTPGDYQRFHRLGRAATLLGRTSLPLYEIALRVGFSDQSHFTRSFAVHFGVPPGQYRRLTR